MNDKQTPPPDIYDQFYFEHACGGHEEFEVTEGETLSPWMIHALYLANLQESEMVLDLATGRGEIVYHAAKTGCVALGLDYALPALQIANRLKRKIHSDQPSFNLVLSDARQMPFKPDQFDVVFMLDIVEHLAQDDLLKVLRQVYHTLRKGGRLIIHTMPNINYYRWGYPVYRTFMGVLGKKLPKDPKERFYHGECHVNIQSPKSLRKNLQAAGFRKFQVTLTQLSGSKFKKFFCRIYPLKYIIANDIVATCYKE